jgi:pimeloyl-ACP methyl ester carboxylesterase
MFSFPPKNKAACGGESIEYVMTGNGPFTVVLVNGSGGPIEGWHKVFDALASFSRVFAYNRPGIGASSRLVNAQTGSNMVASLRAALEKAGCRPPYVLVGHSFGGLIVNLFARRHPSDVAAVVMLEATAPDDVEILPAYESRIQRLLAKLADRLFPRNPNAETLHAKTTVAELNAAPPFPAVPLVVVTGGKPAMAWLTASEALAARAAHQRGLVQLSPVGRHVMAEKSGHFPQFTEPDVVVAAVKEAIERAVDMERSPHADDGLRAST